MFSSWQLNFYFLFDYLPADFDVWFPLSSISRIFSLLFASLFLLLSAESSVFFRSVFIPSTFLDWSPKLLLDLTIFWIYSASTEGRKQILSLLPFWCSFLRFSLLKTLPLKLGYCFLWSILLGGDLGDVGRMPYSEFIGMDFAFLRLKWVIWMEWRLC